MYSNSMCSDAVYDNYTFSNGVLHFNLVSSNFHILYYNSGSQFLIK